MSALRPRVDAPRPLSGGEKGLVAAEVLVAYARVRVLMWRHPLPEVMARLRAPLLAAGALAAPPPDPAACHAAGLRLGRAAGRTLRLLPTDGRCLMRSLVVVWLLARRGIACTLVIGVSSPPAFTAHAWVELEGRPILTPGDPEQERLVEL